MKPLLKPYVQPASNDPGIGQGRAQDREGIDGAGIVLGVAYGLVLWAIIGFVLVWAW